MQTAIDWDWLLLLPKDRRNIFNFLRLRHVILIQVQIVNLVIDVHILLVHILLIRIERIVWINVSKHLLVRILHVELARIRCVTRSASLVL